MNHVLFSKTQFCIFLFDQSFHIWKDIKPEIRHICDLNVHCIPAFAKWKIHRLMQVAELKPIINKVIEKYCLGANQIYNIKREVELDRIKS